MLTIRFIIIIFFCQLTYTLNAQETDNEKDLAVLFDAIQQMPSYKKLLKKDGSYIRLYDLLKSEIRNVDDVTAFGKMCELIYPINDNHLALYSKPDSSYKVGFEREPIGLDSLKAALSKKEISDVQGIYYYSNHEFGLYGQLPNPDQYRMIDLKTGILAGILVKTPYGGFDYVHFHNAPVPYILTKNVRLINNNLVNTGFSKSKSKSFSLLVVGKDKYDYKILEDGTAYLRLSSFGASTVNIKNSEVFYEALPRKLGANRLIVDLRNNTGGGDKTSRKFLTLLKRYNGKIYILQNAYTVSNAEQFILALKSKSNVTSLGEQTQGMITFGSNIGKKVLLPSNRFIFSPTDMSGKRSELNYESKGIKPDVELDPYTNDWIVQTLQYLKK